MTSIEICPAFTLMPKTLNAWANFVELAAKCLETIGLARNKMPTS